MISSDNDFDKMFDDAIKENNPYFLCFVDWYSTELEKFEKYQKSRICNFCGKIFKNIPNCNKHEEKCKNIPTKNYKDFLRLVNNDVSQLNELQRRGLSLCYNVVGPWNNYESREIFRPDNTIHINTDPLGLKSIALWQQRNEENLKRFHKPLPQFR